MTSSKRGLTTALSGDGELVSVTREALGGSEIAVVRMQRAPVNSLNLALIEELTGVIRELDRDPSLQGMVLASNQRAFSAGLDLTEVYKASESHFRKFWGSFEELWYTLYMSRLATAAAVETNSPAAGSVLALSCDYRVVADDPKLRMGLNETQVGMVCPRWLQQLCARTVGERTSELLLQRGYMMSAEEALKFGFVDEMVPRDEVMGRALHFLEPMVKLPPNARATTKKQQREAIAAMCGPHSGTELWDVINTEECQTTIENIMTALRNKKKK
ncbi:Enoyl-CoA delta isomerase 1, mitochondrial [Hondaea fermentalgiana]|uniref:Enoyl-CoA delta isomerase 1, mitochondrial n=1 Tax=Hondaea fermentalgiana TaxID=2315210 RepID=A0A2R5G742_9STRA|nr:Enoyl-CoA delta isomerase 1, mitochondrial [Hondaea fermentalgiana]|eukprot:GBG24273.1 Enoyl-CoA delta isomerase 1, mitochondrial [Hondaea fermentalgiana]